MTATIPADLAKTLMLSAVGDEAYLEVTAVNPDGSVTVMQEEEESEAPAVPKALTEMLGT